MLDAAVHPDRSTLQRVSEIEDLLNRTEHILVERGTEPEQVGMAVHVLRLGPDDLREIEAVEDDGRTVVVDGERYSLNALTGKWVLAGDPYWGQRIVLDPRLD